MAKEIQATQPEVRIHVMGIIAVIVVPVVVALATNDLLVLIAATAITVAIVNNAIYIYMRRRQHQTRIAAIMEVQEMLQDIIQNQMAVIQLNASLSSSADTARRVKSAERITKSVEVITASLEELSEESLRAWRQKYE